MRRFAGAATILLLIATACGKQKDGDPKAEDFALSLNVEAQDAQVRRIDLPAAALVAIRRADRSDIRVVDAQGRPLSMALIDPAPARQTRIPLKAIPFDSPAAGGDRTLPVSVRVERPSGSVSVEATNGETGPPARSVVFDTRTVRDAAISLSLEVALPKQTPVTLSISMADDLTAWQPLAEQVLFRPGDGPELLGGGRIALPPVLLRGRYMRASWQGDPQLRIVGATLVTSSTPPPPRVSVSAKGAKLDNPRTLAFSVPTGMNPTALTVTMTGRDGVLPLRLLGRDDGEAPWTPLAMASLRQGSAGALMEIGDRPARALKLEADPRSAGFSRAPAITLHYAPVALAVAFNGAAPYRLLVGHAQAKPTTFALSDLTQAKGPLPTARVLGASSSITVEVENADAKAMLSPRVAALWAVLLAGVAVLGYAAVRLMRDNAAR